MKTREIALVLGGGEGKRLWPLTASTPKFLFDCYKKKPLIVHTVERIPLKSPSVFIVSEDKFKKETSRILRRFIKKSFNFIVEPRARNTLPAVVLSLLSLRKKLGGDDFVVAVIPSDHLITRTGIFKRQLKAALKIAAQENKIILFGIRPSGPDTNFGYVEALSRRMHSGFTVMRVKKFLEKPSFQEAKKIIKSDNVFWNSGMFIFRASVFLAEVRRLLPGFLSGLEKSLAKGEVNRFYNKISALQIDKEILEKTDNILLVPAEFDWSDVGNFYLLDRLLAKDKNNNHFEGRCVSLLTRNTTLISADRDAVFALVGLEDTVVVCKDRKILIARKPFSPHIKKIIDEIEKT